MTNLVKLMTIKPAGIRFLSSKESIRAGVAKAKLWVRGRDSKSAICR